jgi:prepilin-type N-terminal cleavage/methylation domain-containing protein
MRNHRGFTLIELLVVIAIIGILSSVVLASLNTARSKGQDAAIQSDITGIRNQAQLYFNTNNHYGPVLGAVESDCAATDNMFSDATIVRQVSGADSANSAGTVVCNVSADGQAYAVAAELVATPGTYFCVDSTGTSNGTNLGATDTHC